LMVVAVIPVSLAGVVPVGDATAVLGADADVDAAGEVAAADELLLLLLLLAELQPAASRAAATSVAISAAKRGLLRRPPPPRPGPSLLGLTACPPRLRCL
jgi:hypothetical protein